MHLHVCADWQRKLVPNHQCPANQDTSYASHCNNKTATNRTTQKGAEDRVWIAWEIQPSIWTPLDLFRCMSVRYLKHTKNYLYIYSQSLQKHTSGVPAHHFARSIQIPDEWPDGPAVPSTEKAICSKGWRVQHIWICCSVSKAFVYLQCSTANNITSIHASWFIHLWLQYSYQVTIKSNWHVCQ